MVIRERREFFDCAGQRVVKTERHKDFSAMDGISILGAGKK
jgi:hypothetical protein